MGKKRKSIATRLDEVDRTIYTTFCSAANSLSQLYTQAMNQQKLAFQAGERHALEKFYEWIIHQEGQGSKVSTADIVAYLQNEHDHGGDEPPMSPRLPFPHQNPQHMMQFPTTGVQVAPGSLGQATVGQGPRSGQFDHQPKNSIFSNALSSPVHRNLQNYQSSYTNNIMPSANGSRNNEVNSSHHQGRESNSVTPNDSSMDMHADTPDHYNYY